MYCYTPYFLRLLPKKCALLDGISGSGAFHIRLHSALIPQYIIL